MTTGLKRRFPSQRRGATEGEEEEPPRGKRRKGEEEGRYASAPPPALLWKREGEGDLLFCRHPNEAEALRRVSMTPAAAA